MYEEVKEFLQARIDARDYSPSLETDFSDQEDRDTLESFDYDASIEDRDGQDKKLSLGKEKKTFPFGKEKERKIF